MKFFLYARKSSETEDRQVASIESQINELTRLAESQGLEIVKVFSEAKSAKAPGRRPIFADMIERINRGEATGILCWKLDRLARNPVDGGTVSWMLQNNVLEQIRAFDRAYNPNDNVLMMSVEFGMANQFIRDLSAGTKRGMRAKAEKGVFPHQAPIGYLNDKYKPKGEKGIINDDSKFTLVKTLWETLLVEKCSIDELHKKALETNLTGHLGKPISRSVFYSMFDNPFYYGWFNWNGKLWKGTHEPMITKEEFDIAREIIHGKTNGSRERKHYFPYSNLIHCKECGSTITAESKTKRQKNGNVHYYKYYRCIKRKGSCSQSCIRAEEVDKQMKKIVRQIDIPEEFVTWAVDVFRKENEAEKFGRKQVIRQHRLNYDKCLQKIDNLTDLRINDEISSEVFSEKKEGLLQEKTRLLGIFNDADQRVDKWIDMAEETLNFARKARARFAKGGPEVRREIVSTIGATFSLNNKVVSCDLEDIFKQVRTASKEVKKLEKSFGPLKSKGHKGYAEMYSSSDIWGAYPDSNRG